MWLAAAGGAVVLTISCAGLFKAVTARWRRAPVARRRRRPRRNQRQRRRQQRRRDSQEVASQQVVAANDVAVDNNTEADDAGQSAETTYAPWPPQPMYEAMPTVSTALDQLDLITYRYAAASSASDSDSASHDDDDDDDDGCAICLSPFEDGDRCCVMPPRCYRHHFHRDCIAKWLMTCNNTCPLCRAQLRWLNEAWCTYYFARYKDDLLSV